MTEDLVKLKIVNFATEKFLAEGLGITMESIASDMCISKKTLYKYFKNKTQLANEVVDGILRKISGIFESAFINNSDSFVAMISSFSIFANTLAPKLSRKVFDDLRKSEPEIWKKIDEFRIGKFRKLFPPVMKEGMERGYLREGLNTDLVLLMYISSVQGILNPNILSHSSFSAKEAALHIITTLFYGITTPKGKTKFDKHFKKITENINEN